MRIALLTLLAGCLLAAPAMAEDEKPKLPAFPGAEGFGAASVGGRGGKVIKVMRGEGYTAAAVQDPVGVYFALIAG